LLSFYPQISSLIPGSIEIVPSTLKKGNVVSLLLNYIIACRAGRLPAMVAIMGDEEVDDGMFEVCFFVISREGLSFLVLFLFVFSRRHLISSRSLLLPLNSED
jgi:hypothetical protein